MREQNSNYVKRQDRHSHLFGKLLLLQVSRKYNLACNIQAFSLLCALAKSISVGVDIEDVRDVSSLNLDQL